MKFFDDLSSAIYSFYYYETFKKIQPFLTDQGTKLEHFLLILSDILLLRFYGYNIQLFLKFVPHF